MQIYLCSLILPQHLRLAPTYPNQQYLADELVWVFTVWHYCSAHLHRYCKSGLDLEGSASKDRRSSDIWVCVEWPHQILLVHLWAVPKATRAYLRDQGPDTHLSWSSSLDFCLGPNRPCLQWSRRSHRLQVMCMLSQAQTSDLLIEAK